MNIPLEFFILVSGIIGAAIGFFGCSVFASKRIRSIKSETWKRAEVFYTRRAHNHVIR